jgi:hypothetical protein
MKIPIARGIEKKMLIAPPRINGLRRYRRMGCVVYAQTSQRAIPTVTLFAIIIHIIGLPQKRGHIISETRYEDNNPKIIPSEIVIANLF